MTSVGRHGVVSDAIAIISATPRRRLRSWCATMIPCRRAARRCGGRREYRVGREVFDRPDLFAAEQPCGRARRLAVGDRERVP
jgi:hypothetical protein